MREIVLAIGSNEPGAWGPPLATLRRAVEALTRSGLAVQRVSPLFETAPAGPSRRAYLNAALCAITDQSPAGVLRTLKQIEAAAGRRTRPRWSARPLDIDIIDDGGRIIGWSKPRDRGRSRRAPSAASSRLASRQPLGQAPGQASGLVLPHPRAHERGFVLAPLLHLRPFWHHPVLGAAGRRLLARAITKPGDIRMVCGDWLAKRPPSRGSPEGGPG